MKIGIVGSSKIDKNKVVSDIIDIMRQFPRDTLFISGGAKGVDSAVVEAGKIIGREILEIKPKNEVWRDYRERNIKIARQSDFVICVAERYTFFPCYHCGEDVIPNEQRTHNKTAGCWTARKCKGGFRIDIVE